jgi:hypothetical protein
MKKGEEDNKGLWLIEDENEGATIRSKYWINGSQGPTNSHIHLLPHKGDKISGIKPRSKIEQAS